MQYAKLVDGKLVLPSKDDYLEDGVTFKEPSEWKEYISCEKPQETAMVKYSERFDMVSDMFSGVLDDNYKIYQTWVKYIVEPEGRAAKLSGKELVFPSQSETLSDGTLICNFNKLPNSRKLECGYFLVIETPYPTDGKTYRETGTLVDDPDFGKKIEIVWEEVIPEPEPPFDISKLKLKRAMMALGKWDAFLEVLKSDQNAYEDFNLAITLMSNDPTVLQFKGICVQMFGFTIEQVDEMLKQCKSDL